MKNRIAMFLSSLRTKIRLKSGLRVLSEADSSPHSNRLSPSRLNRIIEQLDLLGNKPSMVMYLEIGVQDGYTFEAVRADEKVAVEPFPRFHTEKTPGNVRVFSVESDEFFENYEGDEFFLAFVDGLHESKQTYKDVLNTLNNLSPGGLILLDDVLPLDEPSSLPELDAAIMAQAEAGVSHGGWYGDVYKVLAAIEKFHPELGVALVGNTTNHGQALIWRRQSPRLRYVADVEVLQWIETWRFQDSFPSGDTSEGENQREDSEVIRDVCMTDRY